MILKMVRNSVNRQVNCETANLSKTVTAARKQYEDIVLIRDRVGLQVLEEHLEEMAKLRLEYPEASLIELGELLTPKLGKSGVNHRLKKISEYADSLRG
jgi:DNA-binding protein WhiA